MFFFVFFWNSSLCFFYWFLSFKADCRWFSSVFCLKFSLVFLHRSMFSQRSDQQVRISIAWAAEVRKWEKYFCRTWEWKVAAVDFKIILNVFLQHLEIFILINELWQLILLIIKTTRLMLSGMLLFIYDLRWSLYFRLGKAM